MPDKHSLEIRRVKKKKKNHRINLPVSDPLKTIIKITGQTLEIHRKEDSISSHCRERLFLNGRGPQFNAVEHGHVEYVHPRVDLV